MHIRILPSEYRRQIVAPLLFQRAAIARNACLLLLFMLSSGNAYWYWWNSLVPSLLLAPLVLVFSDGNARSVFARINISALPIICCLLGFAVVSLFSLLVNPSTDESIVFWLSAYVSPLLIFIALQSFTVDAAFLQRCLIYLTAGALIPLIHGLVVYWHEWGVPTAIELLASRYTIDRMGEYMRATYGNPGNTAAYIALLFPTWLGLIVAPRLRPTVRIFFLAAIVVALFHVLIVQSRTLFLVLVLTSPCVFIFHRVRLVWIIAASALLVASVLGPLLDVLDIFSARTLGALTDPEADGSVVDRFEAMEYGLRTMLSNPAFGLGPANTFHVNPYGTAHQYWLQQGSELGLWGLLFAICLTCTVIFRFTGLLMARRSKNGHTRLSFLLISGPCAYMLYGFIANMPLASSVVNSWIGIFAAMLGLSFAGWSAEARVHDEVLQ